jgi:hypothetical protein
MSHYVVKVAARHVPEEIALEGFADRVNFDKPVAGRL